MTKRKVCVLCILLICLGSVFALGRYYSERKSATLYFQGESTIPILQYDGAKYIFYEMTEDVGSFGEVSTIAKITRSKDASSDVPIHPYYNWSELIGCSLCVSEDDILTGKERLLVQKEERYYVFISERCVYPWISLYGNLYLNEQCCHILYPDLQPAQVSNIDPTLDCSVVGYIQFNDRYSLPDEDFETNWVALQGFPIYFDPSESNVLYVENPISNFPERFDCYIEVSQVEKLSQ